MLKILNDNTCINYDVNMHMYKVFAPENLCLKAGEFRTIDLGITIDEKQIKFNYLSYYDFDEIKEVALKHSKSDFLDFLKDLEIGKDDVFESEVLDGDLNYDIELRFCGKKLKQKLKSHYLQIELSQNLIQKGLFAMPLRVDFSYKGTLKIHIFTMLDVEIKEGDCLSQISIKKYENTLEEIRS